MKKVVLIGGTGRSGSTLFNLMLGNRNSAISLGEFYALFRPWRPHHIDKRKELINKSDQKEFWQKVIGGGEKNAYRNIFKEKKDAEYIVDSSKRPLWISDQLEYAKNKNYSIHPLIIFKSPSEYAYSLYKRGKFNKWKKMWVKYHKRIFHVLGSFHTVEYKSLARNPKYKLRKVCEDLEIEYEKNMYKFWQEKGRHFVFGSDTVKNSDNLVYYDDQFENEKMRYVKDNIEKDETIDRIMRVLKRREVNLNNNEEAKVNNGIANFSAIERFFFRMYQTNSYAINRSLKVSIDYLSNFRR